MSLLLEKYHANGVTLLGGSKPSFDMLERVLEITPTLFCADGGANFAPVTPAGIIGDMDSYLDKNEQFQYVNKVLIEDQNTTDFDKCLASISASRYICLGFTGGRMDHHFASFSTLARNPDKQIFLVSESDFAVLITDQMCLELGKGVSFSLYPLETSRVRTAGLRWNLEGEEMAIDGLISTSNKTAADRVTIEVISGKLAMILPNTHLETVVAQLR